MNWKVLDHLRDLHILLKPYGSRTHSATTVVFTPKLAQMKCDLSSSLGPGVCRAPVPKAPPLNVRAARSATHSRAWTSTAANTPRPLPFADTSWTESIVHRSFKRIAFGNLFRASDTARDPMMKRFPRRLDSPARHRGEGRLLRLRRPTLRKLAGPLGPLHHLPPERRNPSHSPTIRGALLLQPVQPTLPSHQIPIVPLHFIGFLQPTP